MGLNNFGQVQWVKKYGKSKFEYLNNGFISRAFYKQGNSIYYAGCVRDSNNKQTGVLLKFNLNGDTLWQNIYKDANEDVIPQMVTGSVDNGFLITGFFQGADSPSMLIKTDSNGKELWRKKISKITPNVSDGKAIVQDSVSKNIIIVGYQYQGVVSNYDHILVTDSLGNNVIRMNYTNVGGVYLDLIQTKDKKFVAVGRQYYTETIGGSNTMKPFIIKFDINPLKVIWRIDGFDKQGLYNGFSCLNELNNGDLLIAGYYDSLQRVLNGPNNQPGNILTRFTRITSSGTIISNSYYNYKYNNTITANAQWVTHSNPTKDGGWVAAIEETNFPNPNPFFFVKYDPNGCDSSVSHCATLNAVGLPNVGLDYARPDIAVWPNPADDVINFELQSLDNYKNLNGNGDLYFQILNSVGQKLKEEKIIPQEKNIAIKINDLPEGVYLLNLKTNNLVTVSSTFIINR